MDNGDYFNKKDGTIYPNLGIEYFKTSQWVLKPTRKGPVPQHLKYQLPNGTQTFANEIFSIDGEKYPAQEIKGTVLSKVI